MGQRRLILTIAFLGYLGVLALPLGLAFLGPSTQPLDPRPLMDDLGSALAMVGFAAILVEFFLLGRFRPLSTWLGSDFLMQAHQLFARTALLFIVIHPFLYSLWGDTHRPSDPSYAAALSITGMSLLTGGIAWTLLIGLVFSATRRSGPGTNYDHWRKWHAILAVAVALLGLHHTLEAGRYAAFTAVDTYWWILFALALSLIGVVYVIRPWLQKNMPYLILSITPRAKDIYELVIRPTKAHRFVFQPGHFAWLKVGSRTAYQDHPFSISASPKPSGDIHFLIKAAGDFTSELPQRPVGTPAFLDGPHGHFQIPSQAKAVVMLAGGIGIAPFCSLLQACSEAKDPRPIRLIYGNRLKSQEIDVISMTGADRLADFRLFSVIGEPSSNDDQGLTGQLDLPTLKKIIDDPSVMRHRDHAVFMICGPAVMIDAVESALVRLGVPLSRIISEKFQYDIDLRAPRSRRTLGVWLLASLALFGLALAAALR